MQELMNQRHSQFRDCDPTIIFIRNTNDLIDIINVYTKKYDLQVDINSYSNKKIIALLLFTFSQYFFIIIIMTQ